MESGSKPCHFLAEWPWTSHMTTLPLYFLLYKVEVITIMRTAAILIILSCSNSGGECLEQCLAQGKSIPYRVAVLSSFPLIHNFCFSFSFETRCERVVASYTPFPTQWGIGALSPLCSAIRSLSWPLQWTHSSVPTCDEAWPCGQGETGWLPSSALIWMCIWSKWGSALRRPCSCWAGLSSMWPALSPNPRTPTPHRAPGPSRTHGGCQLDERG